MTRRIALVMSLPCAALHWQVFATFAALPNMPPTGCTRAFELSKAYLKFSRGEIETDDYPEISDDKDTLAAVELEAYQPANPALNFRVSYSHDNTKPLVIHARSPWDFMEQARQSKMFEPAGLFLWMRAAQKGDTFQCHEAYSGLTVRAETITAKSESVSSARSPAQSGAGHSKSQERQ